MHQAKNFRVFVFVNVDVDDHDYDHDYVYDHVRDYVHDYVRGIFDLSLMHMGKAHILLRFNNYHSIIE